MKISDAMIQRGTEGAIKLTPVYLFEMQFLINNGKETFRSLYTYIKSRVNP